MATNSKALSHDEIWDDSALVESWDQALQEYKVCTGASATPARRGLAYANALATEISQHLCSGRHSRGPAQWVSQRTGVPAKQQLKAQSSPKLSDLSIALTRRPPQTK